VIKLATTNGPRFGLDLGRAAVKLVRCERNGTATGAERRVDPSLQGDARQAALVAALTELGAELGVRPHDEVNVAVPRAKTIVTNLTLPLAAPDELDRIVRFQAAKSLPFDLDDMALTWSRIAISGTGQEIVFAAVRQTALESLREVVSQAGFEPGHLEVSTQAAARTLVLEGKVEDNDETLLVEVGHATTDVLVLEGDRLVFSRSASVGCGNDPSGDTEWLARLAREVVRSVVAARTGDEVDVEGEAHRTGAPTALFLAGGAACLEELGDALKHEVGVEPQILLGLDGDPARGARFVIARGLADPRAVVGVPVLDFSRRAEAKAAVERRRRTTLSGVLAAAGVATLILASQATLASLDGRIESLEAEQKALAPAVAKARELSAELQTAQAWTSRKGRELEVFLSLARSLPEDEQVYLTRVRWTESNPLRLTGRAKDWNAVGAFLTNLEQEPLIRKASFESIRKPQSGARGVEFSGQATLVQLERTP
jgi:Tfp pilus assembly protein PilN